MKKISSMFLVMMLLLGACSEEDSTQWFDTKKEAIEYGLNSEVEDSTAKTELLSTKEVEGETLVFYSRDGSLWVASITKGEKGYSWYRSSPGHGFEGESNFTTVGFDYITESGLKVPILAGKAYDYTIEKILLSGDGPQRELSISKDSRLFYAIHDGDFVNLEVNPVMSGE
ncbi:hypothetical protein [Rossellomorea aquimaris]|uniref:hypothetical protein n=1 Tax=Rossellomorea aquimaris TaxID=189382 RepID=UPI0007D0B085|nr:hypothetical protein [Rossellomorea aquimaris]